LKISLCRPVCTHPPGTRPRPAFFYRNPCSISQWIAAAWR